MALLRLAFVLLVGQRLAPAKLAGYPLKIKAELKGFASIRTRTWAQHANHEGVQA